MKPEITHSDVVAYMEDSFSSITRQPDLPHEYGAISRQNATLILMTFAMLNDANGIERERYRKIILDWKKDRDDRRKPKKGDAR